MKTSIAGPTDRILFRSDRLTVANFSVFPASIRFSEPTPIENQIVVFPRVPVRIQPQGRTEHVADPSVVTLYRRGQSYRRYGIAGGEDRCDWFALSETTLDSVLSGLESKAFDEFTLGCPSDVYAQQRRIVRYLERTDPKKVDPVAVEEATLSVLRRLFERPASRMEGEDQAWLVAKTKRLVIEGSGEDLGLRDLAQRVGCSVAHLCRTFKEVTGETVHRYRTRLRVGLALEGVERQELSRVAADQGFSSHSHFTDVFRRLVGVPPSRFRSGVGLLP